MDCENVLDGFTGWLEIHAKEIVRQKAYLKVWSGEE